ncbi:MAG: hypothetical protein LBU16_10400 [Treponema sp.]|jgi:hypothetical protein|nr:hypothetical protein [Treponema sp.]
MARISQSRKAVLDRLEIVTAYLSGNMAVTSFVELFNAGGIYRSLFEETGPVDAGDLDRWTDICMGVAEAEDGEAVSAAV